jgi:hypothetical protein
MNIDRYRIRTGDRNALTRHRPGDTSTLRDKDAAQERLLRSIAHLEERLELLNAQNERALLLIFQGMDASGKDGAINHVMSGVNPLYTEVHMFKQPSSEEMDHNFLWRAVKALPARGNIGIFDRSYYEDVVVVRVHPGSSAGSNCRRISSGRKSGRNASRTSAISSVTCFVTARSSASSSFMCRGMSNGSGCWNGSIRRTRTGNSQQEMFASVRTGRNTRQRIVNCLGPRARRKRPGT